MKVKEIAYARSGDKGSMVNIGVIANTVEDWHLLKKKLTEEKVANYFSALCPKEVVRYALPNLCAFNFLLKGVLVDEKGPTLRFDAQGKALGVALLEMEL